MRGGKLVITVHRYHWANQRFNSSTYTNELVKLPDPAGRQWLATSRHERIVTATGSPLPPLLSSSLRSACGAATCGGSLGCLDPPLRSRRTRWRRPTPYGNARGGRQLGARRRRGSQGSVANISIFEIKSRVSCCSSCSMYQGDTTLLLHYTVHTALLCNALHTLNCQNSLSFKLRPQLCQILNNQNRFIIWILIYPFFLRA